MGDAYDDYCARMDDGEDPEPFARELRKEVADRGKLLRRAIELLDDVQNGNQFWSAIAETVEEGKALLGIEDDEGDDYDPDDWCPGDLVGDRIGGDS